MLYLLYILCFVALALRIWASGEKNKHPAYNVKGKVIIVTGANTGIGYECIKELSKG